MAAVHPNLRGEHQASKWPPAAFIPINTPEEREKDKAYIAALQKQMMEAERKKAE